MQIVTLYLSTALVFLAADAVMLNTVMRPLFERHLGDILRSPIDVGSAVAFYLVYIGGLLWLVSWSALQDDAPSQALIGGAVLGAMAYGTYEFTNKATIRGWDWSMVATDWAWGTVLTGGAALAGVLITRWIHG